MSCYNGCKSLGYPDCNDVQDNCRASGGTVSEFGCEYTKNAGIVLLACYFGYH